MTHRARGRKGLSGLAGVLVLALSLGLAGPALAHALLLRSLPAANAELAQAPDAIELWFSEPLEPELSGARLLSSTGQELPVDAAQVDAADPAHLTVPVGALAPGLYTVAWHNTSQTDGHPAQGSFPFTVLNADGSRPAGETGVSAASGNELPGAAAVAGRWLALLGGLGLFGIPLFQRVVLSGGPAPSPTLGRPTSGAAELPLLALWAAGMAVAVGHWLPTLFRALQLEDAAHWPALILGTRPAALALGRQVLMGAGLLVTLGGPLPPRLARNRRWLGRGVVAYLVLMGALLGWAALRGEAGVLAATLTAGGVGWALNRAGRGEHRLWEALLFLGAAALLGFSVSSHAAAVPGSLWASLGDYLHLLAAGAWVGGLLMLPLWLRSAQGRAGAPLLPTVQRFSQLAGFAVFVIILTGLFNSLVQVPDLPALVGTSYGQVLLVKLGITALALGLAFLNRRLVRSPDPRLAEAERKRLLIRQITGEAGLVLGLMVSVAVLVQTPPPPALPAASPPAESYNTTAAAADLSVHLQVTPNRAGYNRFWVHLYHEAGTPVGEVQLVRLTFNYRDAALGAVSVDLEALGGGAYAAEGAYLSQAGAWDVSIYVRRRGLDDALTKLSLDVPPASQPAARSVWRNPVAGLPAAFLSAGALSAAGLAVFLWSGPLAVWTRRRRRALQWAGMSVVLLALVYAAAALAGLAGNLGAAAGVPRNPFPPTAASLALGRRQYQANCQPCHGAAGRGDGPLASSLQPPPANLQVHVASGAHSDAQLFAWITQGIPNTAMPAFATVLTEAERWHVVNYIRTLAPAE